MYKRTQTLLSLTVFFLLATGTVADARPLPYRITENNSLEVDGMFFYDNQTPQLRLPDFILSADKSDYDYVAAGDVYKIYYALNVSKDTALLSEFDDTNVSFVPKSILTQNYDKTGTKAQNVQAVVDVKTITYPAMFGEGIDYRLTHSSATVKEELILSQNPYPLALDNDTFIFKHRFNYSSLTPYVNGAAWDKSSQSTSEAILFKNANGETNFEFKKPYAIDATGKIFHLTYDLSENKQTGEMNIKINVPMLYLKNAAYPVIIDPSLEQNGGSTTLDGTQVYDFVNVTNGGIIYVTAYNATGTTGTLTLNATYDVNVDATSSINGFKRGYRGGGGGTGNAGAGHGGEPTGSGGGSDGCSSCNGGSGGGGGGYGTAGAQGGSSSTGSPGGAGGSAQGTSNGWDIRMGSGGGGGGGGSAPGSPGTDGEAGGAMLAIHAGRNINIYGTLNFNGGNGGNGGCYDNHGGAGSGASGGGILLNGTNIDITGATITANGGTRGTWCGYDDTTAGSGGGGRYKAFYKVSYTTTGATISAGSTYSADTNSAPTVPVTTQHDNFHEPGSTTVTWSASTDPNSDPITYSVKVGTTSGGTNVLNYAGDTDTTSNSFNTANGTTYYYSVKACDAWECSAWSAEKSFTQTNNAISISGVLTSYTINEGQSLLIDANYTDADGDTGTFSTNATKGSLNTSTGYFTYNSVDGDEGTYVWNISVSDGYGSVSRANFTVTVLNSTPGVPGSLGSTTGNFWVNHTWSSGGNTDAYNVSINGTWANETTDIFYNSTGMSAHGWANISVYGFNNTLGALSAGVSQNTQIPNNAVSISNISSTYTIDVGGTLFINPTSTDADSDTPTFATSATKGTFYTNNGTLKWTTTADDSGTYDWAINVTDGYGSTATKNFSISVNSSIPGAPLNIASTSDNFWVNTTWDASVNTNTFNVSVNGTWTNGSAATFMNTTGISPHGWANVTVLGYNTTSLVTGNSSSASTQLADNLPAWESTSLSLTSIYTTQSVVISMIGVTDTDGDSINITAGVTLLGGSEVNYTMTQTAETNNWTYTFSSLTTGTYNATHFYLSTDYGNISTTSVLQFIIGTEPVIVVGSGGGGGGGTTTIVQQIDTTTPILLTRNLTTGATEPDIEAIAKCLTEGLLMANSCSGNTYGIQVDPANWWVFLGAIIAGILVIGVQILRGEERDWLPDVSLYSAVTIILVVALEFVGVNMYFLNYIVDSPKYAFAFFSIMSWGFIVAGAGDYLSYKKQQKQKHKKIYKLTDVAIGNLFEGKSQ